MKSINELYDSNKNAIALIGIGCRFPGGANNADEFWKILEKGEDAIIAVPQNRWSSEAFYNQDRNFKGKTVSKYGGFVDNIDKFDAQFFGITPREAPFMDPQQRLLLEASWEAMEDAGMVVEHYAGKDVGVFLGAFTLDYKILQFGGSNYDLIDVHTATGTMMTMIANRISFQYDFMGPSMAVDTACSSSLVSIHLACQSIRNKECSMALAGGVLLNMAPQYTIAESQGGFLSVDGKCKTLDESANGYVRGEGVGVVVLKPLAEAIRDNDDIYSVILGSAVNQDGHTNSITVPNPEAQKKVIYQALNRAEVKSEDIQYVEMHGTGTSVGDPLEVEAIGTAMSQGRPADKACYIGSVKTNIGHTESAAGVASVIKVSLCLRNKKIPPHINLHKLNNKIDLESYNIKVPMELMDWPEHEGAALAGVNGFGFGGTNSHIVIGEAPEKVLRPDKSNEGMKLFPITARSEEALKEYVVQYQDMLVKKPDINLYDLGYSMVNKRDYHNLRLVAVAKDKEQLKSVLSEYNEGIINACIMVGKKKKKHQGITFIYTGMGAQWWKMGRVIMQAEKVFMNELQRCDKEFFKYSGWSLIEELLKSEDESKMSQTYISQPTNFALQVALTALWKSKGVCPDVIVGHSAGEVAAFYCAGAMSFEDAVKVIYYRSNLQQKLTGKGKMLAISMDADDAREYVKGFLDIDIVAINSNSGITLAGEEAELNKIAIDLEEKNVFHKFLFVNVPFHSHYMEEIKTEFESGVKGIKLNKPQCRLYSTVYGREISKAEDISYWWFNIRQTVLFASAINEVIKDGYDTFVEIGPHPALTNYVNELAGDAKVDIHTFSSLNRKVNDIENYYSALAGLFACGAINDLSAIYSETGNYVKLPFYPWQREKYWLEDKNAQRKRLGIFDHVILGRRLESAEPCWEMEINEQLLPFIPNHKIQGNKLYPAAAFIEMGMQAAKQYYGEGFYKINNILFKKAVFINPEKAVSLQVCLDIKEPGFTIYNISNQEAVAQGSYQQSQNDGKKHQLSDKIWKSFITKPEMVYYKKSEIYKNFHELGFGYYEHFTALSEIWVSEKETFAHIDMPNVIQEEYDVFAIHPGILDACFQTVIAIGFVKEESKLRLPVEVEEFSLYGALEEHMKIHCTVCENSESQMKSNIILFGSDGNCIAHIKGFIVRDLEGAEKKPEVQTIDKWLYEYNWQPKELTGIRKSLDKGLWIVLHDQKEVADTFCRMLQAEGEQIVSVKFGGNYSVNMQEGNITVREDSEEDMYNMLKECSITNTIHGIIDFLNIDLAENNLIDSKRIYTVGSQSIYPFIYLVRGLSKLGVNKTKIYTVTCDAQKVFSYEESQILQRPAWGVARLLRNQENTAYWGGVADLQSSAIDKSLAMFIQDLLAGDEEDQLAYRDNLRYVGRLNPINNLTKPFPLTLDAEGYYMVTGAFGALGGLVIDWLVEKGVKKLILVGRSRIPQREQWSDQSLDEQTVSRINEIRHLENQGIEVIPAVIDMANESQIYDYFDKNRAVKEKIKGIISTAGIVKDMLMTEMPKEVFDQVYNIKTIGNWTLHKIFEKQELEFFVMFSSITAMVTATGQANYISANSFLDGLADYRRGNGLTALSIAWGPWNEGMIQKLNLQEVYMQKGMTPITGINGISVLERIIKQNIPYALVIEADWIKIIDSVPRNTNPYLDHLKGDIDQEDIQNLSDEEILEQFQMAYTNADKEERKFIVQEKAVQLVGKVLHLPIEKIEMENSLSELGIDSMMTTELKNRLEMNTGAVIPIVDLLNNQSLYQLAVKIQEQLESLLELNTIDELVEDISEEELDNMMKEIMVGTV